MKYLKSFLPISESSIKIDNDFVYIDGLNDEDHFLYSVMDLLNTGLQKNHKDEFYDCVYSSFNACDDIFNGQSWITGALTPEQKKQTSYVWNFLNLLLEMIDNGENVSEIERLIHDLVVSCKLPKYISHGTY
jgi:hypothetical protein